jgi:putative MATE family efflux protein
MSHKKHTQKDEDLVTTPIPRLIRSIAIPAGIGMLAHTMFNVVDTYFAGRFSVEAVAALSLSFPLFFIIIAVGSGLATGTTSLIGNSLGEGRDEKAQTFSVQGLVFGVSISFFLTVLGLKVAPDCFRMLGAEEQYLETCLAYMDPIFYGTFFFMLVFMANAVLQAKGDTKSYRNFLIAGSIANIGLDPWFMYGGLGVPAMGITGVAVATVLVQAGGAVYLILRAKHSGLLDLSKLSKFRPRLDIFKEIAGQGIPASINWLTVGAGIFVITYFVSWFGQQPVAAYGIATRVEQIALLPTAGLNIAALTLAAQNNGAGRFDRVREAWIKNLQYGFWLMIAGTIFVYFLAEPLMAFFTPDTEVVAVGAQYLRISAFALYAYVVLFTSVSVLIGMKRPMFAVWMGLGRQVVAPCVLFYVLIRIFGVDLLGVWWGIFLIVWLAAAIAFLYAKSLIARMERLSA